MSRTAHHTPLKRWNQREHHESVTGDWSYDWPTGNTITDLRFYAGCKRTPQRIRREVACVGYPVGHGGKATQVRAREIEGGFRAGLRAFAAGAAKTYRADGHVGDLLEPDARTRHGAIWDWD